MKALIEQLTATNELLAAAAPSPWADADAILAALPVGVVWIDSNGIVRHANAAAIAALGTPLLLEYWRSVVARLALDADGTGDICTSGARYATDLRPWGDGELIVLQDVTGLRRFERARQRNVVGRLAAGLAQVLRTELSTLQIYLDLSAEQPAMLTRAQVVADALVRHGECLLALARGGLPSRRFVAVADVLAELRRHAELGGHGLRIGNSGSDRVGVLANVPLLVDACLHVIAALRRGRVAGLRANVADGADMADGADIAVSVGTSADGHRHDVVLTFAAACRQAADARTDHGDAGVALARCIAQCHGGELDMTMDQTGSARMRIPRANGKEA